MGFLISDKQLCSLFMVHYCPPVSIGGTVKKSEKSPSPNHHQTEPLETGEKGGEKKKSKQGTFTQYDNPVVRFSSSVTAEKNKTKVFYQNAGFY